MSNRRQEAEGGGQSRRRRGGRRKECFAHSFIQVLNKLDVEAIEPLGQEFDPNMHKYMDPPQFSSALHFYLLLPPCSSMSSSSSSFSSSLVPYTSFLSSSLICSPRCP